MTFLNYYRQLAADNEAAKILSHLFGTNLSERKKSINEFSDFASKKLSDLELKKYLSTKLPLFTKHELFLDEAGIIVTPEDAILIIEDLIFLEIIAEELKLKNGRRLQFLSGFKNTSVEFLCFSIEFLYCKLNGFETSDLLSYSGSLKKFELNYIQGLNENERISLHKKLIYRKRKCIFLDEDFLGFDNFFKINSIDEMFNLVFDEVKWLSGYFFNKEGLYFEKYKSLNTLNEFPKIKITEKINNQKENPKAKVVQNDLLNCLNILELSAMPKNLKELKKAFYKLAQKTHPDKFEHLAKGKQTEILIVDKFRRVQSAYEFIAAKLNE